MSQAAIRPLPQAPEAAKARAWLDRSVTVWFLATALGQLAFVLFIVLFYYPSTLGGNFAAWNSKPLITGYVPGDRAGNLGFAMHVLLAAIMTLCGLMQLLPTVRLRWPRIHRTSGRIFMTTAMMLAIGGFALVWLRGSWLTVPGAVAITLDGVLVLGFAVMAWRSVLTRNIAEHRRWALRLFVVASGVWMMRVGYIAWGMATGGLGIAKGMSGPFDLFWAFATHLLPLLVLECYLVAARSLNPTAKLVMSGVLAAVSMAILAGSVGAWLFMWSPYI